MDLSRAASAVETGGEPRNDRGPGPQRGASRSSLPSAFRVREKPFVHRPELPCSSGTARRLSGFQRLLVHASGSPEHIELRRVARTSWTSGSDVRSTDTGRRKRSADRADGPSAGSSSAPTATRRHHFELCLRWVPATNAARRIRRLLQQPRFDGRAGGALLPGGLLLRAARPRRRGGAYRRVRLRSRSARPTPRRVASRSSSRLPTLSSACRRSDPRLLPWSSTGLTVTSAERYRFAPTRAAMDESVGPHPRTSNEDEAYGHVSSHGSGSLGSMWCWPVSSASEAAARSSAHGSHGGGGRPTRVLTAFTAETHSACPPRLVGAGFCDRGHINDTAASAGPAGRQAPGLTSGALVIATTPARMNEGAVRSGPAPQRPRAALDGSC